MNTCKASIHHSFILLVFMISIPLLGCDTPECCGLGCGILGGSASCHHSPPSVPFKGFHNPADIAVTADGDFVVTDNRSVVYVDQFSGDRTIISQSATLDIDRTGGGPNLGFSRIAVRADGDFAVIGTHNGLYALANVDQNTGRRTILSDEKTGSGPDFFHPSDFALTTTGDFVVLNNVTGLGGNGEIMLVDQDTGDRSIISDEA